MEAFGRKKPYSLDSLKKPLLRVIFHVRYFFLCIFDILDIFLIDDL